MYRRCMPSSLKRLVYAAVIATAVVIIGGVLLLGWDWLDWITVIGAPRYWRRQLTAAVMETFLALYFVILTSAALATTVLGLLVWRSRSRRQSAQWLLLCVSTVFGLVVAEAFAATWLSWIHDLPALPHQFARAPRASDEILIVVIGGSSALGVPYERWLSVARSSSVSYGKRFRGGGFGLRSWPRKGPLWS